MDALPSQDHAVDGGSVSSRGRGMRPQKKKRSLHLFLVHLVIIYQGDSGAKDDATW